VLAAKRREPVNDQLQVRDSVERGGDESGAR
jgi:hypothetical protein